MTLRSNLVDIKARKIYPVSLETEEGKITSITPIDEVCDTFILPGFIDAHIHIESSMCIPTEFARLAVRHGSVATVSDPHEIANVLGKEGVHYMIDNARKTPFKFYFGASPCVPATPFETSGATLDAEDVTTLLQDDEIYFLSEVMNFPGVINNDADMMAKIEAAKTVGKPIDGHAPGLSGKELDRYITAGITTDHEASTYEEGLEKLQKGMKILIREGSAAKNFDALEPLISEHYENMMFCSDDRHPDDLSRGHINTMVTRAIAKGHDLFHVLQMACINPVEHYKLDVGQLKVGDAADFIEIKGLKNFQNIRTIINGVEVARDNKTLLHSVPAQQPNIFKAKRSCADDFVTDNCLNEVEVIEVLEHQLLTHESKASITGKRGYDLQKDILKIAVINRYKEAPIAVAHIHGFGFKEGAIASSVAHDSHNIIIVGCSDKALSQAANLVIEAKGGISAVSEDKEMLLRLPVAGLMSDGDGFKTADDYEKIDSFIKQVLKTPLDAPYMTLSFMALLVIPELKLSDKGLFDAKSFHFINSCSSTKKQ